MVKRKNVVIALGNIPPFDQEAKIYLNTVAETREINWRITERDLITELADANAVILAQPHLTKEVIQSTTNLEIIVRFGVGVDNIDLKTATERGILVVNFPDALTESVAEHGVLLMLSVARNLNVADRSAREGRWDEFARGLHVELWRKKIGIVGYGRIGSSVASKARAAFDMTVLAYDPYKSQQIEEAGFTSCSLETLLKDSDVICLTLPLTHESEGMIGRSQLKLMKRSAILINISRGRVVNETALYEALKNGELAGAGLDVLAAEPPKADDPLLSLDNVVLTPHCSAHTREMVKRLSLACAETIVRFFRGEELRLPASIVNPEVIKKRAA
jgi:D-3-phosphoglycerate dehydrogenase